MKIMFKDQNQNKFLPTLRTRVDQYFRNNHTSRFANSYIYFKSVFLFSIYLFLYFAILSNYFSNFVLMFLFMGLGIMKGLVGFNVVHDALHGSYSSHYMVNKVLGYLFDLNGTSSFVWRHTHNGSHHTYTNIPGHDGDIDKAIFLRISPTDKLYPFHYYQNWYATLLYSFLGFNWVFFSDYRLFFDIIKKEKVKIHEIVLFFFFKALNFLLFIVIPLLVIDRPIWVILLGYLCLQLAAGVTISLIFQLAHIVENVTFPEADEEGVIHQNWAVHEIMTTSNFATQNPFITFILGGLNFQVEHHLFPNVCHAHYPEINKILRETTREFDLPYNENPTLMLAIKSHFRKLKHFGRSQSGVSG